ncbi:MAG: ATP-dependent helicase [Nocardioidaceae bacterium]
MTSPGSAMSAFSPVARSWFTDAFAEPTPAQVGAWQAIAGGSHTLVVAPTGSGKTLAAFLWALDRLAVAPRPDDPAKRCRVLYVSPMKALAVDVERNLRAPLAGLRQTAARLGLPAPDIAVGVRSGDTPADERRRLATRPPDVLITTPESLFLMLTSRARESLRRVDTVIVDEVHAVAGTKRGAHLALSLERLDQLLEQPAQRIGLSATVRPVDEVARFLGGAAPATVVAPASRKQWDLQVVVPVEDMADLAGSAARAHSGTAGAEADDAGNAYLPSDDLTGFGSPDDSDVRARASIWPHVEERIVDLIERHRSTIVFANSRRLAERLTARLNEIAAVRAGDETSDETLPPAEIMAQSGAARGASALLARAHHGSVSKEQRAVIEDELKAGRLPCVVATSSLELGIDMGAVDLVIQVESPPSVASGLQRVGRAGHSVGEISRGVLFPKHRGDLVQTAVTVERMRSGQIEALRVPTNPLDVLAQQIVASVSLDDWQTDELFAVVRRAASFATLPRSAFDATLDLLAGRYPSDEFAELRPRLVWDRVGDTLTARPGAQRLAVTSGGTIPDRGLFGVFLVGSDAHGRASRVGELDEEMVYESRVGDIFALGTSSWRIEEITHDRVLVSPAPGQPGRLPFWKGDTLGRPAELGAAIGAFVREVAKLGGEESLARAADAGLDAYAAANLVAYLDQQVADTGCVPHDRQLVVERFRDELGDWRLVLHSPYGAAVHGPWALAIGQRLQERFGVDAQAMSGDDGIVLRVPETDAPAPGADICFFEPDELDEIVTTAVGGSALFASRFRECAARALLLPRRDPGRRSALWQQRQKSAALLQVASKYGSFPIVLEAVRECLQDVYDLPALVQLMRDVESRRMRVVEVETTTPSAFARSLLFGYVAEFIYEGDSPLAERKAAALALDPALLSELLGRTELRDLLDPDVIDETEQDLQWLSPDRRARDAEGVADMLRLIGPLSLDEIRERCTDSDAATDWVRRLQGAGRAVDVRIAGRAMVAAVEDVGRLRDSLGVPVPPGVPAAFSETLPDPLGDLVSRFARSHGPFTTADVASRWGLGVAVAADALRRLGSAGRITEGEFRPGARGGEWCDAEVLRRIRRRSLARARAEVEPVERETLARFLPVWQHVGSRLRGVDGVLTVVEQLAGCPVPASALEPFVLSSRLLDYSPPMLDELTSAGEVVWAGGGALPGVDGWVSLHPADSAPLTLPDLAVLELTPQHQAVLDVLASGGGFFFRQLADAVGSSDDLALAASFWDLTWAGHLTNDTIAPLRALLSGGTGSHRRRPSAPRARFGARGGLARPTTGRPHLPPRSGPPTTAGRWSLTPQRDPDITRRAHATAEALLERHGVVTRGSATSEQVPGGFAAVYKVLARFEESGRCRRGYFVAGLGAAQFSTTGAVDRLRALSAGSEPSAASPRDGTDGPPRAVVLTATDPANPFGAALPWPERAGDAANAGHRPGRKAGALVVIVDGLLVVYVERGGRTLLTFSDDPARVQPAVDALALAVHEGALGRLTVERADGEHVLGSPLAVALEAAGFYATPRGLRLRQ